VRAYYLETWFDYRGLWMNPDNRSIHFGYWDEDTMSHAEAMHMNRATVRSLGIRPGDRVLDAGCGARAAPSGWPRSWEPTWWESTW